MDLVFYVNEFLQEKGTVIIPKLGTLFLKQQHAKLDESGTKFLPPTQTISFHHNETAFDPSLSKFIAEKSGENLFVVQNLINDHVSDWLKKINQEKSLRIEIGEFKSLGNQIIFEDKSKIGRQPTYFGLEEIDFAPNPTIAKKEETAYRFSKSIFWVILLVIFLVIISFFALFRKELIFGNTSVLDSPKQSIPSK